MDELCEFENGYLENAAVFYMTDWKKHWHSYRKTINCIL